MSSSTRLEKCRYYAKRRRIHTILSIIAILISLYLQSVPATAQSVDSQLSQRIEAVRIVISNPTADAAFNNRVSDQVRRTLGIFPEERFVPEQLEFALARVKRGPHLEDISYSTDFGASGGVVLHLSVRLKETSATGAARGALATGRLRDLPVLYDANGSYLKLKFETMALHYGNANAWYGRPGPMLAGNPLVVGNPSGRGYQHWVEGYTHFGLYGITPITESLYVYGGLSGLASASIGQELFTDRARGHVAVEDAYAGFITGYTTEAGNRLVLNVSAGRQRFLLGDGFLIANTSANGHIRAALQANPRWSADMLAIAQISYNDTKLEIFHLDPDELPVVDTRTIIQGVNLEHRFMAGLSGGVSFLYVPRSSFGYYTPTGSFTREGLQVYNARFRWQPYGAGRSGPFFAGEFALQRNSRFDMLALGYQGEAGYSFADLPWSPTLSYRYARFSGDNPRTSRFERWDPLLSGGNGEQWVQGINHFKVVQDSNVIAHRFQVRLRPTPKIELVPQLWFFTADSLTNIGGNPALSFLGSNHLGTEVNLTIKYLASRRVYVHGHIAATFPGKAVRDALGGDASPWLSTMLFVRTSF